MSYRPPGKSVPFKWPDIRTYSERMASHFREFNLSPRSLWFKFSWLCFMALSAYVGWHVGVETDHTLSTFRNLETFILGALVTQLGFSIGGGWNSRFRTYTSYFKAPDPKTVRAQKTMLDVFMESTKNRLMGSPPHAPLIIGADGNRPNPAFGVDLASPDHIDASVMSFSINGQHQLTKSINGIQFNAPFPTAADFTFSPDLKEVASGARQVSGRISRQMDQAMGRITSSLRGIYSTKKKGKK